MSKKEEIMSVIKCWFPNLGLQALEHDILRAIINEKQRREYVVH